MEKGCKQCQISKILRGGGQMLGDKNKIILLVRIIPILAVVLVSTSLIILSIIGINDYFNEEMKKEEKQIQYQTIYNAKKHLKAAYGLVDNVNLVVTNSFKREIKIAVDIAFKLLDFVYQEYKNYPKDVILQKIKEHLSSIRFYVDKSGYFFIYDMKGNLIMLPIKPQLEGSNLFDYQDIKGKYVIKDFIQRLKTHPEGIYSTWYYYKPDSDRILEKLGFVRYYKPFDIFIGTAVYEDTIKKEACKRIKQFVSKINTSMKKRNLMIMNDNGKIIYATEVVNLNTNQFNLYKDVIKQAKENSDKLIDYKMKDRLILAVYYKPLHLTIIQNIDLNKLDYKIKTQKENINKVVSMVIKQFLLTALFFVLLVLILTIYLTNMIKKIFDRYDEALNNEKEKAQKAAKVKSEFLANMSHEIRTPLNAMFGFIKILQEKELDEESQKYLNIIEKSGQNLLTIINDILDFSKIEAGKFPIEKIEFNPKEEIEVIKELFASKASEKNILLEIKEENLNYNIISDPTRIKQIIANLLSNAIKFTQSGKKIELIVKYDDKNEKLYIEVKDEGIGIPPEKQKTIFEAFSQADNSTTRKYGGTGLGLTISYRLVNLLGGELRVESEVGKGSRFFFEIPAKKAGPLKEIKPKHQNLADMKFDYHILVVEDNAANQMFLKVILKKMGVTFDIANNGLEAVEKYKKNYDKYDFILMDENMPKMNGIEATKKIREFEREHNLDPVVIIALTANALEGDKERFILAGMNYYLSKPLDIEKLKEIFIKEKK